MKRRLLIAALWLALTPCLVSAQDDPEAHLQAAYKHIQAVLKTKVISVDFKDAAFKDAIDFLRVTTGINIVVDPDVYQSRAEEDLRVTLKIDELPAGDVLDLMLRFEKLGRSFRHGVLFITIPEKAQGLPFMRIYDVRDLTVPLKDFPGVDIELKSGDNAMPAMFVEPDFQDAKNYSTEDIVDLLREQTGPDSWDLDPRCRITIFNGVLIVTQTLEVHKEIAKLLAHLRSTR